MKFTFYSRNFSLSVGSDRIYIHNLSRWVKDRGYHTVIATELSDENIKNSDVIVLGKRTSLDDILAIRKLKKTDAVVGLANAHTKLLKLCDFFISDGDPQTSIGAKFNPNYIKFPLLEDYSRYYKKHEEKPTVIMGYHGNLDHLEQMSSFIFEAITELSKFYEIEFRAIYNVKGLGLWEINRPKGLKIADIQWDVETIEKEICNLDIGIVPNALNITPDVREKMLKLHNIKGGTKLDWVMRYKATVNAGRAFVFHQLGIPVISELYPEAYSILGRRDTGYVVQSKEAFSICAEKLITSHHMRQKIADNAKKEFDYVYDLDYWINHFIEDVSKVKPRNVDYIKVKGKRLPLYKRIVKKIF